MFRFWRKLFASKVTVVEQPTEREEEKSYIVKPCFDSCISLETTAELFCKLYETMDDRVEVEEWRSEVYNKLCSYIKTDGVPTFDEIDAMLLVCRILLEHNKKDQLNEFILMCPKKFIITYSNNSESTLYILRELETMGLNNICDYLMSNIHISKINIWTERNNKI